MSSSWGNVFHALSSAERSAGTARVLLRSAAAEAAPIRAALIDTAGQLERAAQIWPRDAVIPGGIRDASRMVDELSGAVGRAPIQCFNDALAAGDAAIADARFAATESIENPSILTTSTSKQDSLLAGRSSLAGPDGILVDRGLEVGEVAMPAPQHGAVRTALLESSRDGAPRAPSRVDLFAADPHTATRTGASEVERATAEAVRDELARVYGAVTEDIVAALHRTRDTPLDALPRYGSSPTLIATPERHAGRIAKDFGTPFRARFDRYRVVDMVESRAIAHGRIPNDPALGIKVPVGEYGVELATALADAARIMNAIALETIDNADTSLFAARNVELLQRWSFRGLDIPMNTVEGINSYATTYGMLTTRRIPGMSAAEAVRAVDASNLDGALAKAPLNVIGPANLSNLVPREAATIGAARPLRLGESMLGIIEDLRAGAAQAGSEGPATGRGCPLALSGRDVLDRTSRNNSRESSWIRRLGDEYAQLVDRLLASNPVQPG